MLHENDGCSCSVATDGVTSCLGRHCFGFCMHPGGGSGYTIMGDIMMCLGETFLDCCAELSIWRNNVAVGVVVTEAERF